MEQKVYAYKSGAYGEPIEASVYYRKDVTSSSSKPLAIYFHGGSFVVGNKDMVSPNYINKLLDLGFGAVVSPNYRLCPTISVFDGPVTDSSEAYVWAQKQLPTLLETEAGIKVDADRTVVWGHSCGGSLALLMARMENPPRAILDLFGFKYFTESVFHRPAPIPIPDLDQNFVSKVLEEFPPPSSAVPPFGRDGPDFSTSRNAFFFDRMKKGTLLKDTVIDGDYDRIDPAKLFSGTFPPTCFIHGGEDTSVPTELSERAYKELKLKGVETEIIIVEGARHGFDALAKPDDEAFQAVARGLEFLAKHV